MTPAEKHTQLMKDMGSKSGEWDPMPPAQYEAFLDVAESEENRLWAALLMRTIARANDGSRSAFAREKNGRITQQVDLVAECQMSASAVSEALQRLEKKGKIRRETKPARIWLRADVPAPDHVTQLLAKRERTKVRVQITLNAEQEELLLRLQEEDPERFRAGAVRIIAAQEWGAQVKADAIAWAREREAEAMQQVFTELGYTRTEKRGAKRKPRPTQPQAFQVAMEFEKFSVQNSVDAGSGFAGFSVQDQNLIAHRINPNSVQTPHPYGPELQSSESQLASQGEVNAKPKTSEAELKREAARAEIKTEITTRLHRAKLTVLGATKIDARTLNTLANELARLDTAGAIREVLEVLEERAREIRGGKRGEVGWGYLVNTVRGEIEKKLPADVRTQINAAAAGKRI